MSSVFSAESSVMHVIRCIAKSGMFINYCWLNVNA